MKWGHTTVPPEFIDLEYQASVPAVYVTSFYVKVCKLPPSSDDALKKLIESKTIKKTHLQSASEHSHEQQQHHCADQYLLLKFCSQLTKPFMRQNLN